MQYKTSLQKTKEGGTRKANSPKLLQEKHNYFHYISDIHMYTQSVQIILSMYFTQLLKPGMSRPWAKR